MKRIDKIMEKCSALVLGHEPTREIRARIKKNIIQQQCPIQFINGTRDEATTTRNGKSTITGCRGITCTECWNKGVVL